MEPKKIIISTGGTGGHIFPALVLARYLKNNGFDVLITGNEKIRDYLKNEELEYRIISSGYSLKSFKSIKNIVVGIVQSFKLLKKFKPDMIIGFGSYTTLPILLVACFKKIPFCLHEQNSHIGNINRFFLKNAKYIFTSFQEIYGIKIEYSDKIVFTGVPIRDEVKKYSNNEYIYPKENEKFNIIVTGGSGGASFFSNEFIKTFSFMDKKIKDKIRIFHQVKELEEMDFVEDFYKKENVECVVKPFFENMPELMFRSHLIVARSGVGTASEIAAIGRPVIFVPSPNVMNNHQTYNANFYKRNDACLVVEEKSFIPSNFAKLLTDLILNKEKLEEMAGNIKKLAVGNAEEAIAGYIG